MSRILPALGLLCFAAPVLVAQQLTPRDAFWSASDLVSVQSNPGAKASAKRPAPRADTTTGVRTRETPRATAQMVAQNGYGEQPHLVRTSLKTQQLGLRYSLLLRTADGSYMETSPDTVFHSGDHLRLNIMSNEPGYLYVIQQGSSGNWSPIFPIPNSGPDSNHVEPGTPYLIPGNDNNFQFNQTPGIEHLFVILSRDPIRDLDAALQRLKSPTPTAETAPQAPPRGELLEASNHIPDDLVQRLASRDLVLVSEQKVGDAAKESSSGEKAVYVVAKQDKEAPAHEVVTRITLNHQ